MAVPAVMGRLGRVASLIFATVAQTVIATHLRRQRMPYRKSMMNDHDMQYFMEVTVGGQALNGIVDTGSFDVVVMSSTCETCGPQSVLYNPQASHTYEESSLTATLTYGSGTLETRECSETVSIGPFQSNHNTFWSVYDADMMVLQTGINKCIFGMGQPAGAERMAQLEAQAQPEDPHLVQIADSVKRANFFVQQTNMHVFSYCLLPESGSEGYFVMDDIDPKDRVGAVFSGAPVVGDMYWAVLLSDVRINGQVVACQSAPCHAILDTGTSLLAAPTTSLQLMYELIRPLLSQGCQNITMLPNLEFKLGGVDVSLPPSLYMGELSGGLTQALRGRMVDNTENHGCEPAFFAMDDKDPELGDAWILGLPFFRKYYTSFVFSDDFKAKDIFFAEADLACEPTDGSESLRRVPRNGMESVLKIDPSKVRVPGRRTRGSLHPSSLP